jgi:hypothetical protein
LLNAARSALQDATPLGTMFIRHAMPDDFLNALSLKLRKFERALDEYASGKAACKTGDQELRPGKPA